VHNKHVSSFTSLSVLMKARSLQLSRQHEPAVIEHQAIGRVEAA
jgi:hypothetical protein